jgi:hypothetical protein
MTTAAINACFDLLLKPGALGQRLRRKIGMKSHYCTHLRHELKHKGDVRLETKVKWLRRAGFDVGDTATYSHLDLLAFARFTHLPTNKQALQMGFEYLLDKWQATRTGAFDLRNSDPELVPLLHLLKHGTPLSDDKP